MPDGARRLAEARPAAPSSTAVRWRAGTAVHAVSRNPSPPPSPECCPLILGEQVVAPVQRRAQGLVAARRRPGAADEHGEDVVETLRQLADGKDPEPCRGQLDSQRQAVEPPARPRPGGYPAAAGPAAGRPD